MRDIRPMPSSTAGITLAEALSIWVELTGVEPGYKGSFTFGEWGIKDLHKTIQEALDLDPTEVTGKMILAYIAQEYFESRNFSVDELLTAPEKVSAYLAKANTLAGYLRSDAVEGQATAFAQGLKEILRHYESLTPGVEQILDTAGNQGDRAVLAILRRDALRSVKSLQVNQFLDGEPENEGTSPAYGKYLYQWDNINSMLAAMVTAPSGVTINMIRTASNPYGVYFVFSIRNGGRLFTFTDKEWTPHPLAESMWRRPDKILAARADRNWFPYDVAGLKFNEEGRAYIDFASGTSLVPYQGKATPVKLISELAPAQVIWISMMLELIVEKFWHQGHTEPELSYTGEMVRVATPLLEAAKRSNLPLTLQSSAALEVAPITLEDVHSDSICTADVGKLGDGAHRWMEERYKHRVLPETLDVVANPGQEQLLVRYVSTETAPSENHEGEGAIALAPALISKSEVSAQLRWPELDRALAKMVEVKALDATSFGTKVQLEKDRRFLARANYASQIGAMAKAEFEERSKEIQAWVKQRVAANLENLKPLLMAKDAWVHTAHRKAFGSHGAYGVRHDHENGKRQIVTHRDIADVKEVGFYYLAGHGALTFGRLPYKKSCLSCHFTGAPSSHLLQITPETTEQLAFLCGVQVQELPDVLQHWNMVTSDAGNHILNRIDPMDWAVRNPWIALHFKVNVFVSKRAFAAMQKETLNRPWTEPAGWLPLGTH